MKKEICLKSAVHTSKSQTATSKREQELSSRRVNRALEKDDANDDIIEDEYNSIAAYVDLETSVYRHGQALTKDGVIKFEKHPVTDRELSGSINVGTRSDSLLTECADLCRSWDFSDLIL